jgi:Cytochrome C oxidase, cbb3-type, subunit III
MQAMSAGKPRALLLLAGMVILPGILSAQTRGGVPTTDQQKSGEAIFYRKCTFCHVFSNQKKALIPQYLSRTELVGLYKDPLITDEAVRDVILKGVPRRMPSFQYTLTSKEVDDLIAYLKIR